MNKLRLFFLSRRSWTLPYLIFSIIFVIVPLLLIVVYAFTDDAGRMTLENFRKFLAHPEAVNTFIYSIGIAILTTIGCIVLGYPAAWILSRSNSSYSRTLILLFILLYRLSDEYKAPMAFVFYKDMGFSNAEIAYVSKIYGMLATIAGGLLGGIYIKRSGLPKALMLFGVLQGVTNLVYIGQAYAGDNVYTLSLTICMDNLAAGMGTTALVAYMASLCNVAYSATQYALLSSLMSLPRDIFASTSGILADHVSWPLFFLIASLMVLPGLFLLAYMIKKKVLS